MGSVVVTGAAGFVGRHLVSRLLANEEQVIGIGRSHAPTDWPKNAQWVRADIANSGDYASTLKSAACVIHLAAVTGKASPNDYQSGNVDATRTLIDTSLEAGVPRFFFVSSIATKFEDRRHYPYAESKISAETLVREAPIDSVIIRPTMILGAGSPIEESLRKLASLPIAPIFGNGRTRVQPIDVRDVAGVLARLVNAMDIANVTIEIGGPETYDLRDLYARLHRANGGDRPRPRLHLPLGLIRAGLALIEKPLLPVLPLTAGQLATFANDGVAAPHSAHARLMHNLHIVPSKPDETDDSSPHEPIASDSDLAKEFSRYSKYVANQIPTEYQTEKYIDFHQQKKLEPRNAFDTFLLRVSGFGGVGLAIADAYSGLLYRRAVLRSKLVVTLAILEVSAPSFEYLDTPESGGRLPFIKMALRGAMSALSLLVGAIIFIPAQLILGRRSA